MVQRKDIWSRFFSECVDAWNGLETIVHPVCICFVYTIYICLERKGHPRLLIRKSDILCTTFKMTGVISESSFRSIYISDITGLINPSQVLTSLIIWVN